MGPRLIIFIIIMIVVPASLANHYHPKFACCEEANLTVSGCYITEVVASGLDHLLARRSDGLSFKVEMSMMNLAPRHCTTWKDRAEIHFRCRECERTRFAMIMDNEDSIFVRSKNESGNFILLESRKTRWEEGWPDFRPECDPAVPLVLRRLFNCNNETHDENYFLHHVGTFYSLDRKNSTLVGYYRRHGDVESDGWTTRVIAWNEHGEELDNTNYLDRSGTISLTGWREKDGKELVITITSSGHMCLFYRSYDSLDFLPPGKGDKFMPECLQGHMLFGCPQDFCYTGFVDEILESERQSGLVVTLVRGLWWHHCQVPVHVYERTRSDVLRLNKCNRTKMRTSFKDFTENNVAAAYITGKT